MLASMEEIVLKENCNVNAMQSEQMLYNATVITEMAMDLKETCLSADKHLSNLRNLTVRAGKSLSSCQQSHRSFLMLAQKLCTSVAHLNNSLAQCDKKCYNVRYESDKLLAILHRELAEMDDNEPVDADQDVHWVSDKLRHLEHRQRAPAHCATKVGTGARACKFDIDAKYPEQWLKNSFMDLENVLTLPPVPEAVLATMTRPKRTASLASLKSCRRVKLCLQRADSNSEEEEEEEEDADSDEQNVSRNTLSDSDERESVGGNCWPNKTTSTLDDIKEENEI